MSKKITLLKKLYWLLGFILLTNPLFAQNEALLEIAKQYLHQKQPYITKQTGFDWVVTDKTENTHKKITYLYLRQTYQGIEIINANSNMAIKEGKVIHQTGKVIAKILQKNISKSPSLTATDAIQQTASHLSLTITEPLRVEKTTTNLNTTIYSDGGISLEPIPTKLVYWQNPEGNLVLAWDLSIYPKDKENWWSIRIDAQSGQILEQGNWVTKCTFDPNPHIHQTQQRLQAYYQNQLNKKKNQAIDALLPSWIKNPVQTNTAEQYNIYPMPIESPNHGSRSLVATPFDTEASPFGWHDTNGVPGAEFITTRGNNVHAYEDRAALNVPGFSPNGGASLNFDFPINFENNPSTYEAASITNLFYWNNIMHDVMHHYGFDEQSGNFQVTNYSGQGIGNDEVRAEDQDGSGTNNANFGTPPDGSRPRMQMFLWSTGGGGFQLIINSPSNIAGTYTATGASFGANLDSPLTGDLVLANDGTATPTLGCAPFVNSASVNGKIAVVDRGDCTFAIKAQNAQSAGAIALLVLNNVPDPLINMGGDASNITIPLLMVTQATGNLIKNNLANGVNVTFKDTRIFITSSFDNGIVAHEYGHGISNRLTGGASNVNCLGNAEQMGEGWSDYFSLILTMKPTDLPTTPRGIGTYAAGQPTTGGGIRPAPYTTNMSINPFTYASVANTTSISQPHGIGFIWCSMLWDMTWLLIDRYGFDENFYTGTGGNNIALQLVTEGMKLQPCSPGFVDGRDAILLADRLLYDGANQELIWEAFARRGLGASANQGSPFNRTDGTQAFNLPNALEISKIADKNFASIGDIITYQITVKNLFQATKTNIVVSDVLPAGLTPVVGSLSEGGTINGNTVQFAKAEIAGREQVIFSFQAEVTADEAQTTKISFIDTHEEENDNWTTNSITGENAWTLQTSNPNGGENAWFVENIGAVSQQILNLTRSIEVGNATKLAVWHSYNTEADYDGGVIEVSTDNGNTWSDLGNAMLENGYNTRLQTGFSNPIEGRNAFSGSSNSYIKTVINLSAFSGQRVLVRFRFATDIGVGAEGWYIDEVFVYEGNELAIRNEACISYQGLNTPDCATSKSTTIFSNTTLAPCAINAGNIESNLALPILFCNDDAATLTFTNNSISSNISYRYLLTTASLPFEILIRSDNGTFNQTNLGIGVYRIWGFAYSNDNALAVNDYLASISDIGIIQQALNNTNICGALTNRFSTGSDARITKTQCTSLPSLQGNVQIDYFPNPSKGALTLRIQEITNANADLVLYNTLGQGIFRENFEVRESLFVKQFDFDRLSAGVYILKLTIDDKVYQGRLVIE